MCKEGQHTEALALISEELGNYVFAIKCYLEHLTKEVEPRLFRRELFYWSKHGFSAKLHQLEMVEGTLQKVMGIVKHHPETCLKQTDEAWQLILDTLSELTTNSLLSKKKFCKQYFYGLLLATCRLLLASVSFQHLLKNYLKSHPNARYQHLKPLIAEVFMDARCKIEMSENAEALVYLECLNYVKEQNYSKQQGIRTQVDKCVVCRKSLVDKEALIFDCSLRGAGWNHPYHPECLTARLEPTENLRCVGCYPSRFGLGHQPQPEAAPVQKDYMGMLWRQDRVKVE